ncbi:MAG: ThuA domain-containing protein [Phycisphaeraceae bacterium]|nr:ThuA domain-containing protein [Phycisphaeraceae bacterium]
MKRNARLRLVLMILSLGIAQACLAGPQSTAKSKRILILTGEDYPGHKWQLTTPVLKSVYTPDPRFLVDVVEDLSTLPSIDLKAYDAVVMHFKNYDPNVPGRKGFDNLARFVQQGGGLALVHFACGAFQEFKDDFTQLAGRAWNPALRGHDPFGEFAVNMTDQKHPITTGLQDFKITDELYTCLDGDVPIKVLATATSKVDKKVYPMAFVLTYGKGKVFHSVLGHDVNALSNRGAAELYRRGTAWVAGMVPIR